MTVRDADVARALSPVLAGSAADAAARLLAEPDGVHCAQLPDGGRVWVVNRYEDVRRLLADPRLSVDKRTSRGGYRGFALPPALDANLLNMDGADHARLRRLVVSAFTARRVEGMAEHIQATCDALIDAFPSNGSADLYDVYAAPLPVAVICDLLGVAGSDGIALRECTQVLFAPSKFGPDDVAAAVGRIVRLLSGLIQAKRAELADESNGADAQSTDLRSADLLSAMIAARDGADRLSEDELLSLAFLILLAGYENSVHLLAAATARLLAEPERAARIRTLDSPHTPQMQQIVEESLRYDQPVANAIRRFPTEDVKIGGTVIPAGDLVYLGLIAANRDPAAPAAAEAHVTFGHGVHYCLGAPLARLETRIALWTLFHRLPDLALAIPATDLVWKSDHRERALQALPITYTAPTSAPTA